MYAVIETGGKQYRVEVGTELEVELLDVAPGESIQIDRVLLVADGHTAAIGRPVVTNASVAAEVVGRDRGEKTISFKYRPKARRRVKKGHRQELTLLRISDIVLDGHSAAADVAEAEAARKRDRAKLEEAARRQAAADAELAARLKAEKPVVAPKARQSAKAAAPSAADASAEQSAAKPSATPAKAPAPKGGATKSAPKGGATKSATKADAPNAAPKPSAKAAAKPSSAKPAAKAAPAKGEAASKTKQPPAKSPARRTTRKES
jgi:large subunit ribosomal protein L21